MKLPTIPMRRAQSAERREGAAANWRSAPVLGRSNVVTSIVNTRGFTMIEIALCLAIVGFALVSILLVLPSGMNTQSQTRQETIIGQDASELIEAIRSGAFGMNDLTNYVYAITNYWTPYNAKGVPSGSTKQNGYTYKAASLNGVYSPAYVLTNGAHIVGLLSTPEFVDNNNHPITSLFNTVYTSNHVVAYVRSLSGLAAEKPPQNNQLMQQGTFSYRVFCVNAPMAADTNVLNNPINIYPNQLADNLRELRLLYSWPQEPNGSVGSFRQSFRASIAGRLTLTNDSTGMLLYAYQSESFSTNAP